MPERDKSLDIIVLELFYVRICYYFILSLTLVAVHFMGLFLPSYANSFGVIR